MAQSADKQQAQKASRFKKINTERVFYNTEKCKDKPLIGYLFSMIDVPSKNRPFQAFLIRTTEPTLGIDREGNIIDVPVGTDMLIVASHTLQQHLTRAAFAKSVYEISIQPTKKIPIGGGQTMWLYDIEVNQERVFDRSSFGVVAAIAQLPISSVASSKQLPPAATSEMPQVNEEDIPF